MSRRLRLTPARAVLWALVITGMGIAARRFALGIGAVSHLSDQTPWGLWVGFDILCGVALAAGGFTVAAIVYVFHLERYRPLLRPAILTGFLGYVLVIIALMIDLGRPWSIWHAIVMWNPRSVMFEVAWCVMLYSFVLALEFGTVVLERMGQTRMLQLTHLALPPLVVVGVILSTLHQSSLGSLFLIVPGKLHVLWYSSLLPLLFFVSAVAVGLAMVALESVLSARAFRRSLEVSLLEGLGRTALVVLAGLLALRLADLAARGVQPLDYAGTLEGALFAAEIGLGLVLPLVLLTWPHVRTSGRGIGTWSALVVGGVVLNRLNVSITGLMAGSGVRYVPSWMEVAITLAIVAAGVLAYLWAAEHLPVFSGEGRAVPAPRASSGAGEAVPPVVARNRGALPLRPVLVGRRSWTVYYG